MKVYGQGYEHARSELESNTNIRHIRIAKNHAQLVGLL